jgi:hypothetical protein
MGLIQKKNSKREIHQGADRAWSRSFPAVTGAAAASAAAASASVEAASLRTAREGVPSAGTPRAASCEASHVGRAGAEASQSRNGLASLRSGLVGRVGS